MRFRRRNDDDNDAAVSMSPLIDCVFLLLIFFLVTSMLKRYERQIPVTLADSTAAVSAQSDEDVFRIGIDKAGLTYAETGTRDTYGARKFAPIESLSAYIRTLADTRGEDRPIELVIEPGTQFQLVIDTLDFFELQGFDNVRTRISPKPMKELR